MSTMTGDNPLVGSDGCCPLCQRPMGERAERNGLLVMSEPWRVFWRGVPREGLPPMQCRILMLLVRFGEVATDSLEYLFAEDHSSKLVQVHISKLRSYLQVAGLPVTVQSIHRWGYRLKWSESA